MSSLEIIAKFQNLFLLNVFKMVDWFEKLLFKVQINKIFEFNDIAIENLAKFWNFFRTFSKYLHFLFEMFTKILDILWKD